MEKYPLVHFLIKDYLHLRDRTKVRYLLSKDVNCDAEDYDTSYEKELNGYTSLLKIKRCDSCLFYRKYKNLKLRNVQIVVCYFVNGVLKRERVVEIAIYKLTYNI